MEITKYFGFRGCEYVRCWDAMAGGNYCRNIHSHPLRTQEVVTYCLHAHQDRRTVPQVMASTCVYSPSPSGRRFR